MIILFVFSFILEGLVLFTCAIPISILKILRILPFGRNFFISWSYRCYQLAVDFNYWYFFKLLNNHLEVEFPQKKSLKFHDNYLLLSNHQTWVDAVALQIVLQRAVPPPKFLVKKELLYFLPLGFLCWAIDSPFLNRASIKGNKTSNNDDQEAIKELIKVQKGIFSSILIFAEGTRKKPHKMKNSRFKKLLNPKAGGAWIVLNSKLGISNIIDLTFSYNRPSYPFYYFLTGRLKIKCYVEVKKVPQITQYIDFKLWINELWRQKDQQLLNDSFHC
ncbi:MAG: 1-acyl-sn-glycerol-3-phosphate acyltransferase [Bacteriovoracaceae bacterium]